MTSIFVGPGCLAWHARAEHSKISQVEFQPGQQEKKEEEIFMMSKVALEQIVGKNSIDADHNICHTINNQSFMIPNFANSMCALACLGLNTVKYHKLNCCAASRDYTDHHVCIEIVLDHVSIWRVCGLGHGKTDQVKGCVTLGCGCVCLGWRR